MNLNTQIPKYSTLASVQEDLSKGKISCKELVEYYLLQIEKTKHLNAYIEVFEQEARKRASELDDEYRKAPNSVGRLYGMVIALKDVICYKDHQVTAASKILDGFTSLFTSTAVERLLKEGVIIIGRVNCDQFAMGSSNENSIYGAVKNAIDDTRVPGGSSGGSAVAVQADTCLASLGSDTGGSVRQPAAFCGIYGFKPTYGRISRYGLLAYASSFDQIGTLTRSVQDAALLLEIMAGKDDFDSTASNEPVPAYSKELAEKQTVKVAYFDTALSHKSLDKSIKEKTFDLIAYLQQQGHKVEAVKFDLLDYLIPTYYVLTTAEASSNLARYDGIRYGYRSKKATDLLETYTASRTEGFSMEVKRRIMLGTFVLSSGYYDAYYTKAQKVRRLIDEKTQKILQEFDFILMPTTPSTAFKIGEKTTNPVEMYLADLYTVLANLVGVPAIALPIGTHPDGLPFGVQFLANKFEEGRLLAFAQAISEGYLKD